MPEKYLVALKPLLELLAEPLYTIEPASPEEAVMIEERMKDYEKDLQVSRLSFKIAWPFTSQAMPKHINIPASFIIVNGPGIADIKKKTCEAIKMSMPIPQMR